MKTRNIWIIIVLLFCVASLFYILAWKEAPVLVPDSSSYQSLAVDLQDGRLDNLHGRTPGYAILLVLTNSINPPNRQLFLVQLVFYLISIAMLVSLLIKFSIPPKMIVLFAVLALLPYNTVHTVYVLTESFTQLLLVSGIFFLILWLNKSKWIYILLAALAIAFSALVRPTYQFLSIFFVILLALFIPIFPQYKMRLIEASVVILVTAILIVGGMIYYNQSNFSFIGLTPDFGYFLSTKTVRVLERLPDEYALVRDIMISHREKLLLSTDSYHTAYMTIWSAIPDLQKATNLSYRDLASYMLKLNLLLIQKAPLIYMQEVTYSLSNFWLPATTSLSDFSSRILQFVWTGLHYLTVSFFFIISIFFTGWVGLFMALPRLIKRQMLTRYNNNAWSRFIFIVVSFGLIFYTLGISILTDMGVARHRVPVELFIFAGIFIGIDTWIKMKQRLSRGESKIRRILIEE